MAVICIFGNSHLSALALALEGNARFAEAGHDLFYWGAASGKFGGIKYRDGIFTSEFPAHAKFISGGRCEEVDAKTTDIIVFYGCSVSPSYETKRIALVLKGAGSVSSGMRTAMLMEQIEQWWKAKAIREWMEAVRRDFPDKKIIFFPQPYEAKHDHVLGRVGDATLFGEVQEALLDYCRAWADRNAIEFALQPSETVVDRLFTDPVFAKGGRLTRSGQPYARNDTVHMDAAFGEIVMRDLFVSLNGA